ncbi:hypothetical protein [Aeromicrobium yanjiei]|uniref:Uncharacterized protein n=1 Tax=Aeromicrobium yanjiei TaxID=2662028 RepID=A0A5Q2MEM4_9ACTN|nr:hypothetical protein [Aeromicrobium yanjiei]QGG40111.1 hypothetical protein GEV26_01250 [Aeromicrobium yanjiei]
MTVVDDAATAPFACQDDDGLVHAAVVKSRAIRCALSRICGVCGEVLARPIAFLGPENEALDGLFTFPPTHVTCAHEAIEAGTSLGQPEPPRTWLVVTTGGFDLVRPTRRGDPVLFHPNSVIDTTPSPPPSP